MLIDSTFATEAAIPSLKSGSVSPLKSPTQTDSVSENAGPLAEVEPSVPAGSTVSQFNFLNSVGSGLADTMSFTQTQDGYLQNAGAALQQMGQLASAAQDPSATDVDRQNYDQQFQSLSGYIQDLGGIGFNGVNLFGSSPVSVASGSDDGSPLTMPGIDLGSPAYSAATSASLTSGGADAALSAVTTALNQVSGDRVAIGAFQARIEQASEKASSSLEGLGSGSSILDFAGADFAMKSALSGMASNPDAALRGQANQISSAAALLLQS
jgi:flagellin